MTRRSVDKSKRWVPRLFRVVLTRDDLWRYWLTSTAASSRGTHPVDWSAVCHPPRDVQTATHLGFHVQILPDGMLKGKGGAIAPACSQPGIATL